MAYLTKNNQNRKKYIWGILGAGILLIAVIVGESARNPAEDNKYDFAGYLGKQITILFCPLSGFLESPDTQNTWQEFFCSIPLYNSPLYRYLREESAGDQAALTYEMIAIREGSDEGSRLSETANSFGEISQIGSPSVGAMGNTVVTDDAVPLSDILGKESGTGLGFTLDNFVPADNKSVFYNLEDLRNFDFLIRNFYIIDPGTGVTADQINAARMMARDMTIDTTVEGPQILIYHTHSQEAFADSVPGDVSTTIVGAGEYLAEILEEQYGYEVLHHTAAYDTQQHNYAYTYAEPAIRKILEEYPSIQVVIDLHRDEMAAETRLVTEINGQPTAQFMFFNGLSYLNELGHIAYLDNPNLESNLAFSFQMQLTANSYYPGLARRIYLKGYRYNMHLMDRYLLIELGAQNNTVQEIRNACYPLADVIDRVISGRG